MYIETGVLLVLSACHVLEAGGAAAFVVSGTKREALKLKNMAAQV